MLAAAAFSVVLVLLAAASSLIAALVLTGDQSLVGLDGGQLSPGALLGLVLVSWLVSVLPVLPFASLGVLFSIVSRNGIVGVLGPILAALAMQLLALTGKGTWAHTVLLASAFDDWHGLFTAHRFYGPLVIGSIVSVAWMLACLGAAWVLLRRRDFTGAPVLRRPGWVVPIRVVVGAAALIVLLGVAGNWGPVAITEHRLEAALNPDIHQPHAAPAAPARSKRGPRNEAQHRHHVPPAGGVEPGARR